MTRSFAEEGDGFAVVSNILHVTRVNNSGAAFGLMHGQAPLLVWVSALGLLFFAFFFLKRGIRSGSRLAETGTALVMGGTLGNLYDRLRYGYVIDFIDLRVWPVFNIADSAITVGIGLLAIYLIKEDRSRASHIH